MKIQAIFSFLSIIVFVSCFLFMSACAHMNKTSKAIQPQEISQIIKITINTPEEVDNLVNLDLDILEVNLDEHFMLAIVTKADIEKVKYHDYKFRVMNKNADSLLATTRATTALGRYHDFKKIESKLKTIASKNPNICSLYVIGKSYENRPIYAMNITDQKSTNKLTNPSCLIMGLHHAREWIAAEVPVSLIEELVSKYNKDDRITKLVNERDIWIVPVVNPDGYIYSQEGKTMWRKNRRPNLDKSFGVDLNRNYGYQWGNVGASSRGNAENYHGTKAYSESCSVAIRDLAKREWFRTSVSFHSYGNEILYPFGYSRTAIAKDNKLLSTMAKKMGEITGYKAMKSSELYPAMGDADDFLYGSMGVLAFTVELGSRFVPNEKEVDKICLSNVEACLYLIQSAGEFHAYNHPNFK